MRVEVHLNDGTKMERTVEYARGSEKQFASEAEIVEKFEKLATHVLPRPQVAQLRDAMLKLETVKDAGQLAKLMTKA